jgi:hypothetical protein
VAQAIDSDRQKYQNFIPEARTAGLSLPAEYDPPTVNVFIDDCEQFVRSFERKMHALSAIPRELTAYPEVQRYISHERIVYP